jgi:SPP1 gp7 family putative phage head morphogenesis protein
MAWDVEAKPEQPQAAIDWFKRKLALEPAEFGALSARAKRQAFTVAGATGLGMVQQVLSSLQKALEDGTTFESWQKTIPTEMSNAWGSAKSWRSKVVFDTAIQSAYGAGRWYAAQESERPYWQLLAVLDGRTSPVCLRVAGFTAKKDDPAWAKLIPPLHFRCRTALITLSKEQAEEQGIASTAPSVGDLGGFGLEPNVNEWKPDPKAYDPELWAAYQKTLAPVSGALGTPVSAALELPKSGTVAKAARVALSAIEAVHGDGVLPRIPVTGKVSSRTALGEFAYQRLPSYKPVQINIKPSGSHPELTFVHEVGHFLDLAGFPETGYSSVNSKVLADFRAAVERSDAIKRLQQMSKDTPSKYLQYLLMPEEIFARSYAQFIATESGNKILLEQLNMLRRVSSMPSQWADEDFLEIRDAIRAIMRELQWLT